MLQFPSAANRETMTSPNDPSFIIDPQVAEKLQSITHGHATRLYSGLKKDLPPETRIRLTGIGIPNVFFVQFSYKHPSDATRYFSFTRSINLNSKHAYHAKARVSDDMHKSGTARIVNQNMVRFYRLIGVETVSANATGIGVYAWARMGFIPYNEEWQSMRQVITRRLDYLEAHPPAEGPLSLKTVDRLRTLLASNEPKSFWQIVDDQTICDGEALGKVLTLEDEVLCNRVYGPSFEPLKWAGALHLNDAACMQRLQQSTGIKPEPYQRPVIRLR